MMRTPLLPLLALTVVLASPTVVSSQRQVFGPASEGLPGGFIELGEEPLQDVFAIPGGRDIFLHFLGFQGEALCVSEDLFCGSTTIGAMHLALYYWNGVTKGDLIASNFAIVDEDLHRVPVLGVGERLSGRSQYVIEATDDCCDDVATYLHLATSPRDGPEQDFYFWGEYTAVTPEPVSLLLLGTGLAGVALIRRVKRNEN